MNNYSLEYLFKGMKDLAIGVSSREGTGERREIFFFIEHSVVLFFFPYNEHAI